MFLSWSGYEIDGSDTSYGILVPERKRTVEMVCWYLRLKTVDRDEVITVTAKKRGGTAEKRELAFAEVEQLAGILSDPDVTRCEIHYSYLETNRLYPEIKGEILELIRMCSGKKVQFANPVFADSNDLMQYMDVYFDEAEAKKGYGCSDDVSSEGYLLSVQSGSFCAVEINCSLGAPFGNAAYNLKYLAERYPELQIDWRENIQAMYEDYYLSGKVVLERIVLEAENYSQLLARLLEQPEIFVHHDFFNYQKHKLVRGALAPAHLRPLRKPGHRYTATGTRQDGERDRAIVVAEILAAVVDGNTSMTPLEYVSYVEKLRGLKLLRDEEFTHYTTVFLQARLERNYEVTLKCFRESKGFWMVLDVPWQILEQVKRKFHI